MQDDFSVVGRTIHPGMVVNLFLERKERLASCPGIFRAVLVLSGSAYIVLDEKKFFIESPCVICLNGSESVNLLKAEGFSCRIVYFKPNVINFQLTREIALLQGDKRGESPFRQDLFWLDPFVSRKREESILSLGPLSAEHAASMLDTLDKSLAAQADVFWPCRSRSFFLEFLFYIRNIGTGHEGTFGEGNGREPKVIAEAKNAELPDKIEDILLYLHTNFRSDIALSSLCDRFATNRTSLNGLFQKTTGRTVIQYLIALRIHFACLLLRDTTVPVKELVFRSGFNDSVHFARTFKKVTAMTPLQYRRKYCLMISG